MALKSSLSLVGFLILLPTALAQSTSVAQLFFQGSDSDSNSKGALVASVITADASTTQYYMTCGAVVTDDCGMGPGVTIQQAGSVWGMTLSESDAFSMTDECTFLTVGGTTSAVCVEVAGGTAANDPGMSTTTLTGSEIGFAAVTITAGLEKLAGTGSAKASSGDKSTGSNLVFDTSTSTTALTGLATKTPTASATSASGNAAAITGVTGGALFAGAMGVLAHGLI